METSKYIVWVGGTPNYFNSLLEAQDEEKKWIDKGYDDIKMEITKKIVKDYLPLLKANKYTYYNLDKKSINNFQELYKYLKKHEDKEVYHLVCGLLLQTDKYKNRSTDYLKKYNAMQVISQNIKH